MRVYAKRTKSAHCDSATYETLRIRKMRRGERILIDFKARDRKRSRLSSMSKKTTSSFSSGTKMTEDGVLRNKRQLKTLKPRGSTMPYKRELAPIVPILT